MRSRVGVVPPVPSIRVSYHIQTFWYQETLALSVVMKVMKGFPLLYKNARSVGKKSELFCP